MNEKGNDESLENPIIDINEGTPSAEIIPSLDVVKPNTLLIHKTRTKSVARPPSKEFLKTTVLRSTSMDLEDENKIEHKSVKRTSSEKVSNSITTRVHETKQTIASVATNKVIMEDITSMWQNITLKKTTGVSKQSILSDSPPWLKEFRQRKILKTARGEECLENSERERHTVVEINVSKKPANEEPIHKSDETIADKKTDYKEQQLLPLSQQTAKSKADSNPLRPAIVEVQYNLTSSESNQPIKLGKDIAANTLKLDSESAIMDSKNHRKENVDDGTIKVETTATKQQKEITQIYTTDGRVKSGSTLTESSQIFKTTENVGMLDSKKDKGENINVDPIKTSAQSTETSKLEYNIKNSNSKQQKEVTQMYTTDRRVRNDSTLESKDTQKEDGEKMGEGSDEKIKNFEVRFKNFQTKIIGNVQSLETLITNEFEKQIKEFEEIKTILTKQNK